MSNHAKTIGLCLLPLTVSLSACSTVPTTSSGAAARVTAHSPVAPTDQAKAARAIGNRAADWQLANMTNLADFVRSISPQTDKPRGWVQGTFFLGLADYAELTGQSRYLDVLERIAIEQEWRLGDRTYHADDHLIGQVYIKLARAGYKSADLLPARQTFDTILANRPTNQLMHPNSHSDPQCSDRWCWADALFMAPATWWDAARTFDKPEYARFADEEFKAAADLLFDQDEALFYRDSRFFDQRGADGEKLFWSRGNGWVYGGLVNILRAMKHDDPRRAYYVDLYRRMSDRLVAVQAENGMWRASLLASSKTPPETSGTGFFVYGLAWGLNEGILRGDSYRAAATSGWEALVSQVDSDGRLGFVQQIGDRPDGVLADDSQFYGTGAFLLAAAQIGRLGQAESR